jgi:RNA polymerase sigma factor (sigma-70 family)
MTPEGCMQLSDYTKAFRNNFVNLAGVSFLRNIKTSHLSDMALVEEYKNSKKPEVLGILFHRYIDLLYVVCFKYLKDSELSKDIVMQTYEEVSQKLFTHDVSNFRSWIYVVTKNICLMHLRKAKQFQMTSLNPEVVYSTDDLHLNDVFRKEEDLNQMQKCLEKLPQEQRKTVEMFYMQGKSYKEISGETGLEWNDIRSFIQNGRRNLRNCMEKHRLSNSEQQTRTSK